MEVDDGGGLGPFLKGKGGKGDKVDGGGLGAFLKGKGKGGSGDPGDGCSCSCCSLNREVRGGSGLEGPPKVKNHGIPGDLR